MAQDLLGEAGEEFLGLCRPTCYAGKVLETLQEVPNGELGAVGRGGDALAQGQGCDAACSRGRRDVKAALERPLQSCLEARLFVARPADERLPRVGVLDPLFGALLDGRGDACELLDGCRERARGCRRGKSRCGRVKRDEGRQKRDGGCCGQVRRGERLSLFKLGDEGRKERVLSTVVSPERQRRGCIVERQRAREAHRSVNFSLERLELLVLLVELCNKLVAQLELTCKVVPVVLEQSERTVLRARVATSRGSAVRARALARSRQAAGDARQVGRHTLVAVTSSSMRL